ncbi:exodeoxyribonuclease VII large subunit [bacterium]|nr:exodeoxyribonuclease VII large subunit [bacterium]
MPTKQVLSVSALTALIKGSLEGSFSSVTVEGEISAAKLSSSGHLYFSLKDREALIQAVMFKFRLATLDFDLADGQKVVARGSVSVYAARGQYQLIVQSLARSGIGDLLAMLEERKQRLAVEGLFAPERKRPLPRLPSRVGVVTSPTGAAFRDILTVLGRRNSGTDIILLPTPVQGESAAETIAARIGQANRMDLADVLIVGRGGGSPEDLLAFSDELVVRAVAASRIPVISAVGHEIDWALSDFAADVRAPTPSAAAELVAESRAAILGEIAQFRAALESSVRARLEYARLSLGAFAPADVEARFMRILMPAARRFDDARDAIAEGAAARLRDVAHRIRLGENSLELASPRAVLARGFSIVRKVQPRTAALDAPLDAPLGEGAIVRASSQLKEDDMLRVIFSEGNALVDVREVKT